MISLNPNERLDDLQINNLFLVQDKTKYCFTTDSVKLANFVRCPKKAKVVDLCSGSGVIGVLINAKQNPQNVYCVEIQPQLCDMCKKTLEYNKINNIEIINDDLNNVFEYLVPEFFDTVVCNPPYKKMNTTKLINENREIAIARHEITTNLSQIVSTSSKLLKFGGSFYCVNKEERLIDLITECKKNNLEPKILKICPSKKGANVIILKSIKGGKSGLKIEIDQ